MSHIHLVAFFEAKPSCRFLRAGPVTYYVSDTGNDVSSGLTPDAAWQTVYRANKAMLKPGDRLLFEGGKTFTGGFNLSQVVGTADQPIVVGSYGSGRATLTPPDNITNGFLIYNCGFLEVRNLVFAGVGSTSSHGVMAVATAPGLSHLYLGMLDVSGFAVGINVQSSVASYRDVRVTWCTVHDNVNTGLYLGGSLRAALADVYVGHCESFNHPGERGYGFYLFHVANGLVERSVAHDNGGNSRLPQAFAMEVSRHFGGRRARRLEYVEVWLKVFGGPLVATCADQTTFGKVILWSRMRVVTC